MTFWCVVQTETRREFTAAGYLKRAGYVTKVPRLMVRRQGVERIEPLFPSYIFARAEETNWSPIRWTVGVIRIVMDGTKPAELPEVEMEKIREREGPSGFVKAPKWIEGHTRLRVIRGSFRGFEGIFQHHRGANRVQILLTMLGADVPCLIQNRDVEPLALAS